MNTLIAIIGLGVLCLLFEILNLRKAIIPITIIGLLAILKFNISNKRHKTPNPIIAINVFIFLFD